jgi:hypothetical protein
VALARDHLRRRPTDNPVTRLGQRLTADLPWLVQQDLDTFHLYSFGMCRQCGATAELAAAFVEWLNRFDRPGTESAAVEFGELAAGAKALQFALARVVRGRQVDVAGIVGPMEEHWASAMAVLAEHYDA